MTNFNASPLVQKIEYKGWTNCYRIANDVFELVVTGDVGPRIIRCGFKGGQNLLKEFPDQLGKSGEADFQPRGGHRLWTAPEEIALTWVPDNIAVEITSTPSGLIARGQVDSHTGLQKTIEIRVASKSADAVVIHRITNRASQPIRFAPWALTVMASRGLAITSFPPRGKHPEHLAPTNPLVMWAYTDLSDQRYTFTRRYLALRHDPDFAEPQKIGLFNRETWGAYLLNGELFVKRTHADPGGQYTDFGCSFELFANAESIELESLGPMEDVQPNQTVELTESWSLERDILLPSITDEAIDKVILPVVLRRQDEWGQSIKRVYE